MMTQPILDIIATATFSLGLFGAVLCCLQTRDVWPFRALAAVLLASCATTLGDVPWPIANPDSAIRFDIFAAVIWLIGLMAAAPLFWGYVRVITSVTPRLPPRIWVHALLPTIALILGAAVLFMPQHARLGLFTDTHPLPTGWPLAVGMAGEMLVLLAIVQWGAYVVAIIRRLHHYRKRLRSYVASVEHNELKWIGTIIVIYSAYWGVGAIDVAADVTPLTATVPAWIDAVFGLGLLVILLLFGLRQRPSLAPGAATLPDSATKYEKSALTPAMADRITRKLRAAMGDDKLHRDPNLSLWSLARHIGASPNYISQTLNENIGDSFFDFVNSYRISDAQALLRDTDQTVLEITYDVGFNSRSSFYTAFKKVTRQTPTAYRGSVSAPT
ncbi:helix-turn-helix transcriptional regulator [Octadecabacter sp. G9-8]|uniref:Helix-turn-helix transcriptional regulator n=1 Tax=Octadecabacter dasysiphoniae TaxID=2909341 RepID=A0ABS9CU27_9RHOB|nr:helix-turn-helix transcriptional regulator [Octadecabacter dasysiphoniae]MCF2870339.1 helix-turn-helix transcriptional regulator [Octadecabacter dasysiphoniae]